MPPEVSVISKPPPPVSAFQHSSSTLSSSPSSSSLSSKSQFGRSRRRRHRCLIFNNVPFIHYCCNPYAAGTTGSCLQQPATTFYADPSSFPAAVTFIPAASTTNTATTATTWLRTYGQQQLFPTYAEPFPTSIGGAFCLQTRTPESVSAVVTTASHVPCPEFETNMSPESAIQAAIDKRRDTSPFSTSRSSSTSGIESQDSCHGQQQHHEDPGIMPLSIGTTSSSSSSSCDGSRNSPSEISSLGENSSGVGENSDNNAANSDDYDFAPYTFYPSRQQQQPQTPVYAVPIQQPNLPPYSVPIQQQLPPRKPRYHPIPSQRLRSQQPYSDILAAVYSTRYVTALKLYNEQRMRHLARFGNNRQPSRFCAASGTVGFGNPTAAAAAAANGFPVYQQPSGFMVPMEALEAYILYLESLCPQLAQIRTTIVAEQTPAPTVDPEGTGTTTTTTTTTTAAAVATSSATAVAATTETNETAEPNSTVQSTQTSKQSVPHEVGPDASSASGSAADDNEYPILRPDTQQPTEDSSRDAHFLDEDSLLQNLPKFEHHGHGSSGGMRYGESMHNLSWSHPRPLSARRDFESYGGHISRQRRQPLQMRDAHRDSRMASSRGSNERRSGGLPPIPSYQQLNDSNWRRHPPNSHQSRNYPSRPFSTSDGFARSRERNSYDKANYVLQNRRRSSPRLSKSSDVRSYMGSSDRNRDRSQCSASDARSASRLAGIFGPSNRSSFGSHDGVRGLPSSEGNTTENSFDFTVSDEKRGRAGASQPPDCLIHRNSAKRNGSNKSRNSPPVHLALKNCHKFPADDSVEVRPIDSPKSEEGTPAAAPAAGIGKSSKNASMANAEVGLDRSYGSQRNITNDRKAGRTQDVEHLAGLFNERITILGTGESGCQSESRTAVPAATIGACDRVSAEDQKIAERSVSPTGSIREEVITTSRQEDTALIQLPADARLDSSSETSTPVQELPETAVAAIAANSNNRFELSKLDVLSEEIWYYHKAITQTETALNRKLHLRDVLYYAIAPVFPMCGLYVVGSSLNGFGTNTSDMDLCLMITNKELDQRTDAVVVLNMIQSALAETKWVSHMQLILAKVPILRIRFNDPFTDITVDLNANNSVAIRNTHLLCYYSSFDWRVRPLVSVVKEWAKRRDINDANRSSFTSYSLVLMVIHYLQCGLKQPILPSLQVVYPKRFSPSADVRSLNVSCSLEQPQGWITNETTTLGELLIGFLEYFAFKFDYLKDAISVRLGSKTARTVVARQPSPYNSNIAQWNCICIEEPFTLSNTAHSVHNQMVFDAIRQAFIDGYYELDTNRDLKAFLDVGPISISIGSSSLGASAMGQSESDSATTNTTTATFTSSSADRPLANKNLLTHSSQPNKAKEVEEYELVEADAPPPFDPETEMHLLTAATVSFDRAITVDVDLKNQMNVSLGDENDEAMDDDVTVSDETPTKTATVDSIENVVPPEMELRAASPDIFVGDDITLASSSGLIPKSVLSERQPKELLQTESSPSKKPCVDSGGPLDAYSQPENPKQEVEQEFPGKIIVHRLRKGTATTAAHGSATSRAPDRSHHHHYHHGPEDVIKSNPAA